MSDGTSTLAFFDRTFEEGLDLLIAARDYLADPARDSAAERRTALRLVTSCETMRLTARLTQIMAWLLLQKAIYAGQMSAEEVLKPENQLGAWDVCATKGPWEVPLPDKLQALLDRSFDLYARVARLDAMVRRRLSASLEPVEPASFERA